MTLEQQDELRARAHANPACAGALAARDCAALATLLSVGRVCSSEREIGYGTILEVIGIDAGNKLIDFIKAEPAMRHVTKLLEQGWLRIGSDLVQNILLTFVGDAISLDDANRLCALGEQSDPVTAQQVAEALFNPDGSAK